MKSFLWRRTLKHCLKEIKRAEEAKSLKRITAIIDPKNIASKKILSDIGFISEKLCEIDGLPGEIFGRSINTL